MGDSESVAGMTGMGMPSVTDIGAKKVMTNKKSVICTAQEVTSPVSSRVPETPEAQMAFLVAEVMKTREEVIISLPPREDFFESFVKDHPNALDL